jgi:hypothetical protein
MDTFLIADVKDIAYLSLNYAIKTIIINLIKSIYSDIRLDVFKDLHHLLDFVGEPSAESCSQLRRGDGAACVIVTALLHHHAPVAPGKKSNFQFIRNIKIKYKEAGNKRKYTHSKLQLNNNTIKCPHRKKN